MELFILQRPTSLEGAYPPFRINCFLLKMPITWYVWLSVYNFLSHSLVLAPWKQETLLTKFWHCIFLEQMNKWCILYYLGSQTKITEKKCQMTTRQQKRRMKNTKTKLKNSKSIFVWVGQIGLCLLGHHCIFQNSTVIDIDIN